MKIRVSNFLKFLVTVFPIVCFAGDLDCNSASAKFDILLCNAHEISDLDKELNSTYDSVVNYHNKAGVKGDSLKSGQLDWLKTRDMCLKTENSHSCLVNMYKARTLMLESMLPDDYQPEVKPEVSESYTIQQLEYSTWSGRELEATWTWPWEEKKDVKRHYYRKKSVLINSATGETWGLEYTGTKSTKDGYSWVKIPRKK